MGVRSFVRKPIDLWWRYEQHLRLLGLITGFVFDLFIADRPDSTTNNLFLLSYLLVAGLLIIVLNAGSVRRQEGESYQPLFLLFVLQFCFGGLASNLLVLYGRSGTFAASTLFFLLLLGLVIGNEFLRNRYAQLRFNIVTFYTLLLTYLLIAVPTFVFHSLGTLVFLASGIASLVLISAFLGLVYYAVLRGRNREQQLKEVSILVGLVFFFFNALYFLNIIPPVPLSLKDIGIYHSIERLNTPAGGSSGIYEATYEPAAWFVFWRDTSATYTLHASAEAVCFSSVYAPTELTTPIYHRWQKYDEQKNDWVQTTRVSFGISGGREGGFRGFTRSIVTEGRWRCNVETENGALIGRTTFTVVQGENPPVLSQTRL
jgi:hypothetical protein